MKTGLCFIVLGVLTLLASPVLADSVIRPGDNFEVRIGGVPPDDAANISQSYTVDGEGYLNMPFIGKIQAARMTISAIQSSIEHAYVSQGIFTHPTITVNMQGQARYVNVAGQVKAPGRIAFTEDMTVMTAINAAGDFNEYAKSSDVLLTREGKVYHVNCKKARSNPALDMKVLPGDQIQVSESFW